jgi:hypothetical protein
VQMPECPCVIVCMKRRDCHKAVRHVVVNENTLAYIDPRTPATASVHAGKVHLGGREWRNGPFQLSPTDTVRLATRADFTYFRVSTKGHLA